MKKLLLATTALIAVAGMASADVKLTGYAEIGVVGGGGNSTINRTQFHSDMDVSFHLSGQTDNGLSFGAKIDLDEVATGIPTGKNNTFTNATVWVSGSFGKITLGDTDGALDWALQDIGMGTSLTDDHTTHAGYSGNSEMDGTYGGQMFRYDNTFGDFAVALSAEINDCKTGTCGPVAGNTSWGVGVKYNTALGGVKLGLGLAAQTADQTTGASAAVAAHQTNTGTPAVPVFTPVAFAAAVPGTTVSHTQIGVSVDAKMDNGFRAILNYKDLDSYVTHGSAMSSYAGIGLGYTAGPLLVTANYGTYNAVAAASDSSGYGFAVNYDLGGGAVVMAGYGKNNIGASNANVASDGASTWSLGLGLSF